MRLPVRSLQATPRRSSPINRLSSLNSSWNTAKWQQRMWPQNDRSNSALHSFAPWFRKAVPQWYTDELTRGSVVPSATGTQVTHQNVLHFCEPNANFNRFECAHMAKNTSLVSHLTEWSLADIAINTPTRAASGKHVLEPLTHNHNRSVDIFR